MKKQMTDMEKYWIEYHSASSFQDEEIAWSKFKAACADDGALVCDAVAEMDNRYPATRIWPD